jgi:hypothetical protein
VRWRAPRSTSLLFAVLAVTAAPAAAAQVQTASDLMHSACDLPHEQLVRIARGTRTDRSGELQIVPKQPNYVAGGYSHAGPWNYLQRVPVFWYGPGFVRGKGRVSAPVTSADIAPTEASLLNFDGFRPPDGKPMPGALAPAAARPQPPQLLVTLVWDAGGLDVLNTWKKKWPYLRSLIPDGVWYDNATVGSSPSNTPPIHATIGTGAYPNSNGMLDEYMRAGNIVKSNDLGPAMLMEPTLADLYDRAMGNEPIVGEVATLSAHLSMMGHGSMWGGGDKDIAVTRENPVATTGGAEGDTWNLTPAMASYYTLPPYVNDVPGFTSDVHKLDQADGAIDGKWGSDPIDQLAGGFDTPARIPYETRLIEQLITKEGFGADRTPDLLFLNYKVIDTIGHIFSLNSSEMRDSVAAQDASLKTLVDFLNRQVGAGNWAMVLTADHGHQFDPAVSGAFQIDVNRLGSAITGAFDDADGVPVVQRIRPTQIWLDTAELSQNGHTVDDVARFVAGLTEQQTARRGVKVSSDDAATPVFSGAFPSSILSRLPCLASSGAGTG